MNKPARIIIFIALTALVPLSLPADDSGDPPPLLEWTPPPPGPRPGVIEGLDIDTLEALATAGTIQYFQPRPEEGRFDVVVGMMIDAPVEKVWETASDHAGLCRIMPQSFDECDTISRDGNVTLMHYRLHTSVLKFSFNLDVKDRIVEDPPYSYHLETIEGSLKGRELDLVLVPRGERTLAFLRYYGAMRSINTLIRMVLALIPDFETPVYGSAACYHLRSYHNDALERLGKDKEIKFGEIDPARLDPATMARLCQWQGGLVQETAEGKTKGGGAFALMPAPPAQTWEVMTDFENYDSFFADSKTVVEKREGNELLMRQSVKQFNIYVFSFDFDLHAHYLLEKPERMKWTAIDGVYQDSKGDFLLVPHPGGQTLVIATTEIVTYRDTSLTMRIVKSGEFPFESMVNTFFCRDVLNKFQDEIERRL